MAVSLYDQFSAVDWARYANICGQAAAISCITLALLSALLDIHDVLFVHFGAFFSTLASGLIVAIWEVPLIYANLQVCTKIRNTALDELYLRTPIARTILYTILSIFISLGGHVYSIGGMIMFIAAILYGLTALNLHSEQRSGITEI